MKKRISCYHSTLILSLWLIVAPPLRAQVPAGIEFQVNTYTTNNQWRASVAASAMGDVVVAWSSSNQDGSLAGVFAKRYDYAGAVIGGEFQVNTTTVGSQTYPDVGIDADGNFVIVWATGDIIGQRFSSTGSSVGGEFTINSYVTGSQIQPEIVMTHGGEFVVAWNSYLQDGSSWGIFGQRFDAAASPVGGEFQANSTTASYQIYPNVAIAESGEFVVVWNSTLSDVFGQRFSSSATAVGSEFSINTYVTGAQRNPDVAYDAEGGFVVAWRSGGQDGESDGVFSQRFAGDGSLVGGELQINTYTTGGQSIPALGRSGDGDFLAVWPSSGGQDGADSGVFGQLLSSSGTAVGSEFQVNTYTTGRQMSAAAAMDDAGNFVATWVSDAPSGIDQDGDQSGVFAQRYQSPCSLNVSLSSGQWKMLSMPCDPGASNTVADVFGDDMTGTYGVDWIVFERDEAFDQYHALTLGSALEIGVGYWIKTLDIGETVDVGSLSPPVTEVDLVADSDGVQNLVGHPFDFDVCWADVRVIDGTSVLTLDQADPVVGSMRACDLEPADASCVMSRVMNKWSGAYSPFDGGTPGAEGTLEAYDAIWVEAFKSGIKLRVPARASSSCGGAGLLPARRGMLVPMPEPWSVRLIATSRELRDEGNLFGQLPGSLDGRDLHDLRELSPFASPYLTVVFPQPDWGAHAGDYATDFHRVKARSVPDVWVFEVRASPDVKKVTLSWEGLTAAVPKLRLIDETAGRKVIMRPGGSYTFATSGSPQVFSCRIGPAARSLTREP